MHTKKFPIVLLFTFVWLLVVHGHSSPTKCLAQSPNSVNTKNPFTEDASISAKVRLFDKTSPSLSWFTRSKVATDGTSYLFRESFARSHSLPEDVVAELDAAFTRRLEAHDKNYKELRRYERQEFYEDPTKNVRKLKPLSGEAATGAKPEPQLLNELYVAYEDAEWKAERKLVEELDEVLSREQFESLATEYMDLDTLYIPIVVRYLDLTDEQTDKIKAACRERMKFNFEIQAKQRDLNQLKADLLASEEWYELNYRPLTYMSHRQFRQAAVRLMESWKDSPSFASKLEQLKADSSLRAKCELRALGDLYREWAELEREN